jgi:ATP phosphoribosyltransferase
MGLPKGSLQEATFEIMKKAGFTVQASSRSYNLSVDDDEISARLIRPQDMSRYVEKGIVDAGITGMDWVRENGSDVVFVAELNYSKQQLVPVRWVLAVPNDSSIHSAKDLQGKRIATELVNATRAYLADHGVTAHVEFSHGATEAKAPDLVDAIVELTETGSTLKAHNLRIVDTVMESRTQLIANKLAWQDSWTRQKLENIAMLCQGALLGRQKVGLKMNVPQASLERVLDRLPALRRPTVSPLADGGWFAIETVLDETVVRKLIPELKRAGAEGIIEYPLNKVVL